MTGLDFKQTDEDRKHGITGIHPLAQLFPPLTHDEYEALYEDVRRHGLRYGIVVDQAGLVLDGVHRRRAALEAGMPFKVMKLPDGRDPAEMVLSLNLTRRSLSAAQRAMVGVALYYERKDGPRDGRLNVEQAAKVVGVSTAYLEMAKRVHDHERSLLSKDLTAQVLSHGMSIGDAVAQVKEAKRRSKVTDEPPAADDQAPGADNWLNDLVKDTDEQGRQGSSSVTRQQAGQLLEEPASADAAPAWQDLLGGGFEIASFSYNTDPAPEPVVPGEPSVETQQPPVSTTPDPEESGYERRQRLRREALEVLSQNDPWELAADLLGVTDKVRSTARSVASAEHRHAAALVLHEMAELSSDERVSAVSQLKGLLTAAQRKALAVQWLGG